MGVLLGRIWRAVAVKQLPRLQRPPSRAVVPALGQETARTMRRFQARKRSKPHRGFDKKTLSRPFPKNLLLTQNLCGSPEIISQKSFSLKNIFGSPDIIPPKILCLFLGAPFRRVLSRFELAQTDFLLTKTRGSSADSRDALPMSRTELEERIMWRGYLYFLPPLCKGGIKGGLLKSGLRFDNNPSVTS